MFNYCTSFIAWFAFCAIGLPLPIAFAGEFNEALWIDRLIEETNQMIGHGDVPQTELVFHMFDAVYILGSHGKDAEALRLEEKTKIDPSDEPTDMLLQQLAIGLSVGGYIDKALDLSQEIDSDSIQDLCVSLVLFEQISQGHLDTVLSSFTKIESDEVIQDLKARVCMAYVDADKLDDAKRLAGDPPDAKLTAAIDEAVSNKVPLIDDPNYVDSMVRLHRSWLNDWNAQAEYLRHYYSAKYSAHKKDDANFLKHAAQATQVLNDFPDRLWERLDLAALYYRNGKPQEARSIYSYVIHRFTAESGIHPTLRLEVMAPSHDEQPPAENILDCFSETELQDMVHRYIDKPNTWDMAAMLLALAMKKNNAAWAEEIYQQHPLPEFKARLACYILYKI